MTVTNDAGTRGAVPKQTPGRPGRLDGRPLGDDRGQAAVVLVMVVSVLFVVVVAALAVFGGRAIDRTRAQSLADAAALGSVGRDRGAAARLVDADGGSLVSWAADPGGTVVTVVVRVGDATATARASVEP